MLSPVSVHFLNGDQPYSGRELRPHWTLEKTGQYGSQLVVFQGPCDVATTELVDWEDRLAQDRIAAKKMLHVIGEFFGCSLEAGVLYQRLFMVWAEKLLKTRGVNVVRSGDDLYVLLPGASKQKKLSVSIATVSPVSVLIHWGINIDAAGAPLTVEACGLKDLGWTSEEILGFAKELLTYYSQETEEIRCAQFKVRPVIS